MLELIYFDEKYLFIVFGGRVQIFIKHKFGEFEIVKVWLEDIFGDVTEDVEFCDEFQLICVVWFYLLTDFLR